MEIELQNFIQEIGGVYGLYRDAIRAFPLLAEKEKKDIENIPDTISEDELNKLSFSYAESFAEIQEGNAKHTSTWGEYIERNSVLGRNHKMMANFCIVLIYEYWEYYRNKLKDRTGVEIQSDFMYEMKILRHAIIHKKAILHKNLEDLTWLKKDEKIEINKDRFEEIMDNIKTEVQSITI